MNIILEISRNYCPNYLAVNTSNFSSYSFLCSDSLLGVDLSSVDNGIRESSISSRNKLLSLYNLSSGNSDELSVELGLDTSVNLSSGNNNLLSLKSRELCLYDLSDVGSRDKNGLRRQLPSDDLCPRHKPSLETCLAWDSSDYSASFNAVLDPGGSYLSVLSLNLSSWNDNITESSLCVTNNLSAEPGLGSSYCNSLSRLSDSVDASLYSSPSYNVGAELSVLNSVDLCSSYLDNSWHSYLLCSNVSASNEYLAEYSRLDYLSLDPVLSTRDNLIRTVISTTISSTE